MAETKSKDIVKGIFSVIAGVFGDDRSVEGAAVLPGHENADSTAGNAQQRYCTLFCQTTDATATTPTTKNTTTAAVDNIPVLDNNGAYFFRVELVAGVTAGGDSKAFTFEGLIKRGANAAATSLVGTVTKTIVAQDSGASTWDADVSADTTLGALKLTCTGQASTTIRWVAKVETTEMQF